MNEEVLRQLLGEVLESEFAEYDDPPEWKFSLKHRLAMKRIFARFERNVRKLKNSSCGTAAAVEHYRPRLGLKKRLLIMLCIIVLLSFFAGWITAFNSGGIHGKVYNDILQLRVVDPENGPQTIEYKYALDPVPEGFEIIRRDTWTTRVCTSYLNRAADQIIILYQYVRSSYEGNYYSEKYVIKDAVINGCPGLYIDRGRGSGYSRIVWDDGDYIFEIIADLTKKETADLLKANKI